MKHPLRSLAVVCCFCVLLLLASGCGGADDTRVPVEGEVTLDGRPLAEGHITLVPLGDGVSAGGTIRNGKFHVEKARGPSPGRYRVEIVSYQPTGEKFPDPERAGQMAEELKQVIPDKYNRQSQLEVEVPPSGPLRFKLQS